MNDDNTSLERPTVAGPPSPENDVPPDPPGPGDVLAERYQLIRSIGAGGMGEVFLAEHLDLQKRVAVKVLAPKLMESMGLQSSRFLREARATSRLSHPNIVEIRDFGQTATGLPFIVMEYLEGETVAEALERHGPYAWPQAKEIAEQILAGLAAAHERGIVHRDLKPENCFLCRSDSRQVHLKLLDFGIAKFVTEGEKVEKLTEAGGIVGTPHYMPPEQALGRPVDARSDVYSAGVILFELLTGVLPFDEDTAMAIISHHITQPAPTLSSVAPKLDIDPRLDELVARALAKQPDARYQSAREFAAALARAGLHPGRSRPWVPWVGAALFSGVVIGIAQYVGSLEPVLPDPPVTTAKPPPQPPAKRPATKAKKKKTKKDAKKPTSPPPETKETPVPDPEPETKAEPTPPLPSPNPRELPDVEPDPLPPLPPPPPADEQPPEEPPNPPT